MSLTVKDIDFLPAKYRDQSVKQKARWWQLGVVVLLGGVVAATALAQSSWHRSAEARLANVEPLVATAKAKEAELLKVESRLTDEGDYSQLYSYLQLRWPRTQILKSSLTGVPAGLTVTELSVKHERRVKSSQELKEEKTTKSAAEKAEDKEALPAARRDLADLQSIYDEQETVVVINGVCEQPSLLYTWLAQLQEQPLLAKVELQSMETVEVDEENSHLQFNVRLTVADVGSVRRTEPEAGGNEPLAHNQPQGRSSLLEVLP